MALVMTRTEAIEVIKTKLAELTDERVEALAEIAKAWCRPTVYSTLSDDMRSEIDASIAELDRGEGVPWSTIAADLEGKIKSEVK